MSSPTIVQPPRLITSWRTKQKVTFTHHWSTLHAHSRVGTNVQGAHSIEELTSKLKRPRKIILLVKAGSAVDDFIKQLTPHLEKGDIIIDGGNSHYPDTIRRVQELEAKGFLYVGSGVSGGEEGARHGPSLMPGGSPDAWPAIKEIFQKTSAQVQGEPCADWMGESGAGHYVKMVHNGLYSPFTLFARVHIWSPFKVSSMATCNLLLRRTIS
jgi:6-phosphogluconate dehydrogenase